MKAVRTTLQNALAIVGVSATKNVIKKSGSFRIGGDGALTERRTLPRRKARSHRVF